MKKYRKYTFNPYTPKFKKLYLKEKCKINKILPSNAQIEHVGSTAIPGLGGKGIIDIAIKTPRNKVNQIIKKLEKLGYDYNLEHQRDKRRIFLQKKITYSGKERRIHIHLTLNNEFWNTFIAFRNYLRTHDKERDEGTKYREYKSKFLENITKRALRTYSVGL